MTFDVSILWPAIREVGMLSLATATIGGEDADAWVGYERPDQPRADGSTLSTEYTVEYETTDWPGLARGETVIVWDDEDKTGGKRFRVREPTFVTNEPARARDGRWRIAVLTLEADV